MALRFLSKVMGFGWLMFLLPYFLFASSWSQFFSYSPWIAGMEEKFTGLNLEEKRLIKAASYLVDPNGYFQVFQVRGNYYLKLNCKSDFWLWDGEEWINQVNSGWNGYSCHPFNFFKDKYAYSLGTYGFWRGHADLIQVPLEGGKPEWVSTKNQPLNFRSLASFQTDEGIINLFGLLENPVRNLHEMNFEGYFLEWEKREWQSIEIQWDEDFAEERVPKIRFPNHQSLDLKDYGLLFIEAFPFMKTGWFILNKGSLELYFLDSQIYPFHRPFSLLLGAENSFYLQAPDLAQPTLFEVGELLAKARKVGEIRIVDSLAWGYLDDPVIWVIGLCLIMALSGLIYWNHKKNKLPRRSYYSKNQIDNPNSKIEMSLMDRFLNYNGKLISQQQLDEIFEINHLRNPDLKKVRRARLIQQLNQQSQLKFGKTLIERVRNEEDKRIIRYQILIFDFSILLSIREKPVDN